MCPRIAAAVVTTALAATVITPADPASADKNRNDQWYLQTLHISEAQAISKGAGVTVAVVDSGAYPHPDLRKNLLAGATVISGESGDGRTDHSGHGTNMAAVIAAHGNGSNGVLGIAPSAKLLPVRVEDSEAKAVDEDLGKGVEWAVDNGADVINVSAGAGPTFAIEDAVADALDANIVVVAAAGNATDSAIIDYPAAIDGVLTVGAIGRNGQHASFHSKIQGFRSARPARTSGPHSRKPHMSTAPEPLRPQRLSPAPPQ